MTRLRGLRRSAVVTLAVALACAVGFGYLWSRAGGGLPGGDAYRVAFLTDDIKNLQDGGDVRVAGVRVGEVASRTVVDDQVRVVLALDESVAPLHAGATVRVGLKSLIGQSMVVLTDGPGDALASDTTLPAEAVIPAVDIDEVIDTFDPATRAALSGALTKLGDTAAGTEESISRLLDGLGRIGREGYTATDALAAQSEDLKALARETTSILSSLNTRRAALGSLVEASHRVVAAAAGEREDLARTVRGLPALMTAARSATDSLGGLSQDLMPVADDLDASAVDLTRALEQLPSVTRSVRASLSPALSTFERADQTLVQLPRLSKNVSGVSTPLDTLLSNVNPVLAYIAPYAFDVGSFFGNFGGSFDFPSENGVRPARLATIFTEDSLRNSPLKLPELNPMHYANPYPAPGAADDIDPFDGTYPRVERAR